MPDERTDLIAREAARRLVTGRAADVGGAIRDAVAALGMSEAARPGHGLVRRHVQGMTLQAVGDVAYRETIDRVSLLAEQVMSGLEFALPDTTTRLMGRGARGQIDGGVTLHIRVYTSAPVSLVAATLVELGYEEPAFETADTRFGRFDRLRFQEDGQEIVVTRCRPEMLARADVDLVTGRRIATATTEALRRRLAEGDAAADG